MDIQLHYRPGNTAAQIQLSEGESITAEAGSMIAMSSHLEISTTTHKRSSGGLLKAAKRLLGGESFFLNHYQCHNSTGEIWLGTALAGDMLELDLDGNQLIVQGGSYMASSPEVDIDASWQGFKSLFSGERIFWLKVGGRGKVLLSSFGAVYPIEISGDYIVDTGHIVAFDETLDFEISKAGKSWLNSFLGGEGLVCKFHGRGTLWCQSHNPASFGQRLAPGLKTRKV